MNTAVCREPSNDIIPSTSSDSTFSSPVKSSDEYIPSSETSEKDWDEESKPLVKEVQKLSLSVTLSLIEAKPRRYLGIPKDSFYVIDMLHKHSKCTIADIYLVLTKIRTDRTFAELADNFGTSAVHSGRIFSKCLPQVAYYMQQFIHNIPVSQIKYLLPIPFRARYSNVRYIIDCFEIKIEQPEDPVKQALTWSEYKKQIRLNILYLQRQMVPLTSSQLDLEEEFQTVQSLKKVNFSIFCSHTLPLWLTEVLNIMIVYYLKTDAH